MSRILLLAASIAGLTLLGCTPDTSSVKGGGGDDTGTDGGDGGGGETQYVSIAQIQDGTAPDGSLVVLEDVVVTSPYTQAGDGFFLQDQGGGPWSGIYVFMQGGTDGLFLSVGDRVTVTGTVTEYYDWTELTVASTTAIEVTGEAEVTVSTLDPSQVSDWEQWESCLVEIGPVTIDEVNQYGQADVGGGLLLDDLLTSFSVTTGGSFDNIIGQVGYSFEEWTLNPRTADDLVGYEPAAAITIAEIQQGGLKGAYRIENAVATSEAIRGGDAFYVQDEGGGPWSGIYVYTYDGIAGTLDIQPGDRFNLEASVSEYYGLTELVISSSDAIQPAGESEPVVDAIDPAAVDDWEVWESCLVSTGPVEAAAGPDGFGQTALVGTDLYIDDDIYDYTDGVSTGATWTNVTGLIGQYEDSAAGETSWKVFPRYESDLEGFSEGEPLPDPETVSVADIQTGAVAEGSAVTIEGALVTSALGGSGFFVQDPGGGAYSGIYVFAGDTSSLSLSVGDEVTIVGDYTEYYDLSEISLDEVTVTGTGLSVTADVISDVDDWEPWEGCLVTVSDVSAEGEPNEYGKAPLDNGLMLDDAVWAYYETIAVTAGASWSSITGAVGYDFSEWTLNPSSAADFVE